jgi:hypothetical protein
MVAELPAAPYRREVFVMAGFMAPVANDLRAQAMAAINCWLQRDKAGFDAGAGTDEEAAVLLPDCIAELAGALERLTAPGELRRQVSGWLDAHHEGRLAG